jgi:hypothetical protein
MRSRGVMPNDLTQKADLLFYLYSIPDLKNLLATVAVDPFKTQLG